MGIDENKNGSVRLFSELFEYKDIMEKLNTEAEILSMIEANTHAVIMSFTDLIFNHKEDIPKLTTLKDNLTTESSIPKLTETTITTTSATTTSTTTTNSSPLFSK